VFRAKQRSPLGFLLREYKVGDRVVIDIDPRQTKGMPHRRFQGSVGKIEEVRRRSLVISVPVGNKDKEVITRLEHVNPLASVPT
jgi:large subunit ribosomal protein L21e